ncbi:MAG TPA: hypothetical protein VGM33_10505 [Baekduia sp.]
MAVSCATAAVSTLRVPARSVVSARVPCCCWSSSSSMAINPGITLAQPATTGAPAACANVLAAWSGWWSSAYTVARSSAACTRTSRSLTSDG